VPFDFLRRGKQPKGTGQPASPATPGGASGHGVEFDGLTEEWRLTGVMHIEGRLSDALNRREAIALSGVSWAPIDGSADFSPVPGLRSVDPYDLIIVMAGPSSLPALTEEERAAHKVHKIPYDVALEAPPFRVVGTVLLYPGSEPERLLDRATEMFVPVTDAVALLGDKELLRETDVILVNRFYLRGVEQIDKRTRLRVKPLPGQPLGGISWQDKAR
jgi:hypothetical protein